MKKIPLRIRFTLVASLFLLISCVTLALVSNVSAGRMIKAAIIMPSSEEIPMMQLEPAEQAGELHYRTFQRESLIATCVIVLLGSTATYFAAGYVLKPIRTLSNEVQQRNIHNLNKPIDIPPSADEIQQLTISFNQMLTELQRSFEMQKQFSANAAHELRTPLAVMQAKLDVFSLGECVEPDRKDMVAALNPQLERLSVLIEDLLWFSRDLPLEETGAVQLYPLLCDVADELAGFAEEKKITIQIKQTDCSVQGQDRLLERVFYNLLENAIKYSPFETVITVSICAHLPNIEVSIADQGEGIPEQYRTAIFEPFFRLDKSRSRAVGGSGLGLAVCKKILERHHASIDVIPNNPTGSIFQIKFLS